MINAINTFKQNLMNWLKENGIDTVLDIEMGFEYKFNLPSKTIFIGTAEHRDTDDWFEEYLTQKGCRCYGIPYQILAFLHEVGHSCTIFEIYKNGDLVFECNVEKSCLGIYSDPKDRTIAYWNIPDELAANEWEVKFINDHQDAIVDLYDIWNNFTIDAAIEAMFAESAA